jgi:hypothetical protein
MSKTRDEILEERRRLRLEYRGLYDTTVALLFRHDPIGIAFENTADEYEPEAGTILPRLRACRSQDDVSKVVHEEFVRWFDPATAGPREGYAQIATELWHLWQVHQNGPSHSKRTDTDG